MYVLLGMLWLIGWGLGGLVVARHRKLPTWYGWAALVVPWVLLFTAPVIVTTLFGPVSLLALSSRPWVVPSSPGNPGRKVS